jgi:hypothetical protein
MIGTVFHAAGAVVPHVRLVGGVFNPGTGVAPPGTAVTTIETAIRYLAWGVTILCLVGLLLVAGRMAIHHRQGIGGEHMAGLAWVLAACVLVGACSAIVGALV